MKITQHQLLAQFMLMGVPEETGKLFIDFHLRNPGIWEAFKTATIRLIKANCKHYGAGAIFEHLRYQSAINGDDGFKLNNNYRAYYARLWQVAFPTHADFFETRAIEGLEAAKDISHEIV